VGGVAGRGSPGVFRVRIELNKKYMADIRAVAKSNKMTIRAYLEKRFHDVVSRDLNTHRGIETYFW
jgi:hypothetical protein